MVDRVSPELKLPPRATVEMVNSLGYRDCRTARARHPVTTVIRNRVIADGPVRTRLHRPASESSPGRVARAAPFDRFDDRSAKRRKLAQRLGSCAPGDSIPVRHALTPLTTIIVLPLSTPVGRPEDAIRRA